MRRDRKGGEQVMKRGREQGKRTGNLVRVAGGWKKGRGQEGKRWCRMMGAGQRGRQGMA